MGADLQINNVTLSSVANSTYRIDFYASPNPGALPLQGKRYLGSSTQTTGGGGTVTFSVTLTGASILSGERITATATSQAVSGAPVDDPGNTSPFSTTFVTAPAGARNISGRVYEDVNGDGSIAEDIRANLVTVRLYADNGDATAGAGDLLIASTTTNATGDYSFTGLTGGLYWVAIDSRTITPNAGASAANTAWAEQTYGVAESWTGSGTLGATGAFYGGKSVNVSDNAAVGLLNSEHILRAATAGGSVGALNAGFSFISITNTRGDATDDDTSTARIQQGSLRQFILNSNVVNGVQTSEFSIGAAGSSQTITVSGATLPTISAPVILNAWTQGPGGYTGPPLIQLNGNSAITTALTVNGGTGSTIRGFAINRFLGDAISLQTGGNVIAGNYIGTGLDGSTIAGFGNQLAAINANSDGNSIGGASPSDRNVIAGNGTIAGGAANQKNGVTVGGNNNVIWGNYIGVAVDGTTVRGNGDDGIDIGSGTGNQIGGLLVGQGNLIAGSVDAGVKIQNPAVTSASVVGNTIFSNDSGVKINNSATGANDLQKLDLRTTRNLGIDLNPYGATANDPLANMDSDSGPNFLQNFPVLTSANVSGGFRHHRRHAQHPRQQYVHARVLFEPQRRTQPRGGPDLPRLRHGHHGCFRQCHIRVLVRLRRRGERQSHRDRDDGELHGWLRRGDRQHVRVLGEPHRHERRRTPRVRHRI